MASRVWPRAAAGAGLLVLLLAGFGAALAPEWERPRLANGYPALPEVAPVSPPAVARDLAYTDYQVPVAGTTLPATVVSPAGDGPYPGLVLVHGGGSGTRADYLGRAERLARHGVVSLVYDKRTAGYSLVRRDYHRLAADALAMVAALGAHPGVDPDRVGLWGTSEGGWVVPLAAGRSGAVGFVVLADAPTMTPGEQLSWAIDDGLWRQGAPGGARRLVARAMALGDWAYVRHDPYPPLAALRQPVLAYYSADHPGIPPVESARILAGTLAAAGNHAYTIRYLAGGGGPPVAYPELVADWIHGLPDLPAPRIAGADPGQRYRAVGQPDSPLSGLTITVLVGLVVVGYLTGPAFGRVGRWRGWARPTMATTAGLRLRGLVAAGAGTMVGINLGIGALVATSVLGGAGVVAPAVWLLLRLAAVVTVVRCAAVAVRLWDAWRAGWRPAVVDRVWLATTGGATGLVLLLAGYWELFAPRW